MKKEFKFSTNAILPKLLKAKTILEGLSTRKLKQDYFLETFSFIKEKQKDFGVEKISLFLFFNLGFSIYYENYKYKLNLVRKINNIKTTNKGIDDLLLGLWYLFVYKDNENILLNKLGTLSTDALQVLKYFVLGKFIREVGDNFIFYMMKTYYSNSKIKEEFFNLNVIDTSNYSIKQVDVVNFLGKDIDFPFILYSFKGNLKEICFFSRSLKTQITNEKNKRILFLIEQTFREPIFLFLYGKYLINGEMKIVPLYYTTDITNINSFIDNHTFVNFKDGIFGLNLYRFISNSVFSKHKNVFIENDNDLYKYRKYLLSNNIVVSKKGIGSIKLKTKTILFKIVDLLFDKNYKVIGVKYVNENNEIKDFKIKIDEEEILNTGIDNFYIEGVRYLWNDKIIDDIPIRVKQGLVFKCPMCNHVYDSLVYKKGICINCYSILFDFCKFKIDNEFEKDKVYFNIESITDEFNTEVEKYHITFKNDKFLFKKDLSLLPKNYQLLLPLY